MKLLKLIYRSDNAPKGAFLCLRTQIKSSIYTFMKNNNSINQTIFSRSLTYFVLIISMVLFNATESKSQSILSKMGNGLNYTVDCSCTDSLGNLYAVATMVPSDTVAIYKWDISTKSWSLHSKLTRFNTKNFSTCNFLFGTLYLTGQSTLTGMIELWGYKFSWNYKGAFNYVNNNIAMRSIKFKNKLYFGGGFDSVVFLKSRNIVTYDGTVFANPGFNPAMVPSGFFNTFFAIKGDSLYVSANDRILVHKSPGTWGVIFTSPAVGYLLFGLAFKDNLLYINYNGLAILVTDKSVLKDSFAFGLRDIYSIESVNNRLFLSTSFNNKSKEMYYIKDKRNPVFLFSNQLQDSTILSMTAFSNSLYYFGRKGVKVNGVDYKNIVQVNLDSIDAIGFDTIRGFVYWDKNRNIIKDGNDASPTMGLVENVTTNHQFYLDEFSGTFEEVILGNKTMEYYLQFANFDSCLEVSFSGNIKSSNTKKGITIDSLYFPMVRTGIGTKSLVMRNQTFTSRARLLDTIPLTFNIMNRDCDYIDVKNGSVKITLDANTVLVSSVPVYTSKVGNVYTFSNLTFKVGDNLIKLKVTYPNSNYAIGDFVRHYAKVQNIAGEDTTDNMDSIVHKIVYSYDPNAKHSVPEGRITADMKSIRYYIDFQNLGNDDAVRVTVIDTLNLKMPVYEFQMVANSHPYTVSITPGTSVVTWVFNNINLKPKSKDEAASKGYIVFDAKVKGSLRVGDSIRNRACIYFDYNSPVITNYAVINRVDPNSDLEPIGIFRNSSLKAYPNPTKNYIKIENTLRSTQDIVIYDMKGARVNTLHIDGNAIAVINTESWARGLYLIVNSNGESLKVIIE